MKRTFYILRIAIFILIVFLIIQPKRKIYKLRSTKTVAVLVDDSQSMQNIFDKKIFFKLKKIMSNFAKSPKINFIFFKFSDDIKNIEISDIEKLTATETKTDIVGALEKVDKEFLGKDLDAAILFSDGNQNVEKPADEIIKKFSELNIPIITVVPQTILAKKNISIGKIDVPDVAFRNTGLTVSVKIHTCGFVGRKISAYLKSEETVLQSKLLDIVSDGVVDVDFDIEPQVAGNIDYSIVVPTYSQEKNINDNKKKFTISVEPEKIRILYLCGQPSFNYSFLRNTLKNDPNVELVSFVILRNPENIIPVFDNELSLIPFPVDEIFSKEIFNFDLLILDNFNYSKFTINYQYLANIKNFVVANGKSLFVISGDLPLSVYQNTPIAELLPVNVSSEIVPQKFQITVSHPEHSIVKLSDDVSINSCIWKEMPELNSINVSSMKDKSVMLIKSEKSNYPVVAISECGKGRVMCSMTQSLWRLALGSENPYNYVKLIGQSIKWLTNAASIKQVVIFTKKNYNVNDIATLKIRVKDEYFKPVNDAMVYLKILLPNGKCEQVEAFPEMENGEYRANIELSFSGKYKITAKAFEKKRFLDSDENSFTVFDVSRELEDINVNEHFMKEIASKTAGKFFTMNNFSIEELDIKPKTTKLDILSEINIWDKMPIYLILIFLFALEWFLRRRDGLL
ncbi:MAG: glutamine amidotransferase [Elusimicrobiota bacterium]